MDGALQTTENPGSDYPGDGIPLTREERRRFHRRSDLRAGLILAGNVGTILAALTAAALFPHPLVLLLAACVLAGRVVSVATLTHDATHNALFTQKRVNDFVGRWVLGALGNTAFAPFRRNHMKHHRLAGTADDPDLAIVAFYPLRPRALLAKIALDLSGYPAIKGFVMRAKAEPFDAWMPILAVNAGMAAVLTLAGAWYAYALWLVALLSLAPTIVGIRLMGDHGAVPDPYDADPRRCTRTTLANHLEQIFIYPSWVNYHVEHHIFPGMPPYAMPAVSRLLTKRGYFAGYDCHARGVIDVLRRGLGLSGARAFPKADGDTILQAG